MRFSRGDEESELEQSLIQASVLQSSSRAAVFEATSWLGSTLNRFSGPNRSSQAEPKEGGRKSGFLFLFVIVRGYHKHYGTLATSGLATGKCKISDNRPGEPRKVAMEKAAFYPDPRLGPALPTLRRPE